MLKKKPLKKCATKEHQNTEQGGQATRTEVAQVVLELLVALWGHESLGHLKRNKTYRWAHDEVMDLSTEVVT